MSVRIRLRRVGRKKQPSYRIVVAESSNPRGGVYVESVGFYNPRRDPMELRVDLERLDYWVDRGAGMTPTVASLVRKLRRGEVGEVISAEAPAAEEGAAPVAEAEPSAAEEAEAEEPKAEEAAAASEAAAGEEPRAEA